MAELKARQQQQANHIFKVQQRQLEPAYIQHLETYIVSSSVLHGHMHGAVPLAAVAREARGSSWLQQRTAWE